MEATIFTAVLGVIGLVALWVGTSSRDSFSTMEHDFIRTGLTMAEPIAEQHGRGEQKEQGAFR